MLAAVEKINIDEWCEKNKNEFHPPVCNKLMNDSQLNIMFVGGPNTRSDFHMEEGSEFFYQLRGTLNLFTVQQGTAKVLQINAGEVFLLPSRIPHSPRRSDNSLGLVIERRRDQTEKDCLRWYVDENCHDILWERYFHCGKLERDLVPIVGEFKKSKEFETRIPGDNVVRSNPPLFQDVLTIVPDPISLPKWIEEHRAQLNQGETIPLFPDHPDKEFNILIIGGPSTQSTVFEYETWLYQIEGDASVRIDHQKHMLNSKDCMLIESGKPYFVERTKGSIGMVVTQHPLGNKK